MKVESLWELSLPIAAALEDAVVVLVERFCGQTPSVFIDERTGRRKVSAYLPNRALAGLYRQRLMIELRRLKLDLDTRAANITLRRLKAQDWAESWKSHFPDLSVGRSLLVRPSWSKGRPSPGQTVITLDPGLAFGTGLHPTTHFCLRQVVKHRPRGQPRGLLDLGTGSGILAIAAAKLGYRPVDALDIDPISVRVARANAARNGLRIPIACQDLLERPLRPKRTKASRGAPPSPGYDVVCANLIYDVLLAARAQITQSVRPNGVLVLAGILKRQFAEVLAAYTASGLTVLTQRTEKEWISCALSKEGAG